MSLPLRITLYRLLSNSADASLTICSSWFHPVLMQSGYSYRQGSMISNGSDHVSDKVTAGLGVETESADKIQSSLNMRCDNIESLMNEPLQVPTVRLWTMAPASSTRLPHKLTHYSQLLPNAFMNSPASCGKLQLQDNSRITTTSQVFHFSPLSSFFVQLRLSEQSQVLRFRTESSGRAPGFVLTILFIHLMHKIYICHRENHGSLSHTVTADPFCSSTALPCCNGAHCAVISPKA